jgi:DNA mismatch endonuclease (patch repair protein)
MGDTVSKKRRSEIMSKIKSKNSKIEIEFRKALWRKGFRYKKNPSDYFGKPDLVLPKYKTVIFIDSCFWHGCPEHCRMPSSNKEYWRKKIERNKKRDEKVNEYYNNIDWDIIRIWEHDLIKDNMQKFIEKYRNNILNYGRQKK